jgi:hypothetical protein
MFKPRHCMDKSICQATRQWPASPDVAAVLRYLKSMSDCTSTAAPQLSGPQRRMVRLWRFLTFRRASNHTKLSTQPRLSRRERRRARRMQRLGCPFASLTLAQDLAQALPIEDSCDADTGGGCAPDMHPYHGTHIA